MSQRNLIAHSRRRDGKFALNTAAAAKEVTSFGLFLEEDEKLNNKFHIQQTQPRCRSGGAWHWYRLAEAVEPQPKLRAVSLLSTLQSEDPRPV